MQSRRASARPLSRRNVNHDNRSRITIDTNGNWKLYSNTVPTGAEAIGTVTRGISDTGALIRYTASGQYAQLNAGTIRTLDGRKVAAALGTSGRPAKMDGGKRVQVYLDADSLAIASSLGNGNISAGLRKALQLAK